MSEHRPGLKRQSRDTNPPAARKGGWWSKFIPLFLGVPPIAVWAADEETEQDPAENARG